MKFALLQAVKARTKINEKVLVGANGTIVHVHKKDTAFEVEFFDAAGKTADIVTVGNEDIEPRYSDAVSKP